jgi:hypothetical protein
MTTHNINGTTLELYDGIFDAPAGKFHQFTRYLVIDAKIGSDADAVDRHLAKIEHYIRKGKDKEAILETQAMRQALLFIMSNVNTKHLCLVPLIHSINGKEIGEATEEQAREILDKIYQAQIKESWIRNAVNSFKKKAVEPDWRRFSRSSKGRTG